MVKLRGKDGDFQQSSSGGVSESWNQRTRSGGLHFILTKSGFQKEYIGTKPFAYVS